MSIPMKYLKINCLVVDDEVSMRSTINSMLTKLGFTNIVTAENGKKAWDLISSVKIDLVVCDINMPDMTGTELFKVVKENKKYENLAFIFVTAEARKDTVAKAAEGGANEYLIKPFIMSSMEDKILNVLKKKFDPSILEVHLQNFKRYFENRELQKAEEELTRASEIMPDLALIFFYFGQLAAAKGDANKAIDFYKEAIDKKPMFVKAYNAIGEIYESLGDLGSAIKYYELAHTISPANAERLIALSKLYYKSGESEKAEVILKEAHDDVREDVSTSGHLLGEMYLSKNENEKAVEVLITSHKKNPSDISIMLSLAEAYRKVGQPDKAVEVYNEIIKINPNNAHAHYNLGKTYLEMGKKKNAIESITKAWELNPFSKEITSDLKALAETDKFNI